MRFKAKAVPYSSVVGASVMLTADDGSCAAMLHVQVPNPQHDHRRTSEEVVRQVVEAVNAPRNGPRGVNNED